jgi:TonB family protein
MSSIEREEFVPDDELKGLLERWVAPGPSRVLDKRVETSFAREFSGAEGLSQSSLLPQTREEVVTMKFCSRCEEEFADKFSFCPVDGTPLMARAPQPTDPSLTVSKVEPSLSVTKAESNLTKAEPSVMISEAEPSLTVSREEWPPKVIISSRPAPRHDSVRVTEPTAAALSALAIREEYHLTFLDDSGLTTRLTHELKDVAHEYELTWPEFKRDPFGFTKRTFIGYGQMLRKFLGKPNVLLAMGAAVFAMLALVGVVVAMERTQSANTGRIGLIGFAIVAASLLIALFSTMLGRDRGAAVMGAEPSDSRSVVSGMISAFVFLFLILGSVIWLEHKQRARNLLAQNQDELQVEQMIDIPDEQPTPDPGTAGLNKGSGGGSKPKPEKAAGGGGGGRQDPKPASFGKTPQASLEVPQVVAPDPKPPQIKNPSLPVAATVVADPLLVPPDARVLPYGDFKSKSTDPSSGPGTGNGIGTGTGGGIGPGEGGGIGPGRGGNIGGGDFNAGGGGPGGGGGGGYDRIFTGKEVTSKARLLSKPEPQYTEDARKNQITGTVVLKVVFSSNGSVTNIRTVSGLPYGLTERAIAAARQIKFVPATKDGHQVSMWMQLEYNFNLY